LGAVFWLALALGGAFSGLFAARSAIRRPPGSEDGPWLLFLQLTLAVVTIAGAMGHTAGMLRDCWDPSEIDYGEGIVQRQSDEIGRD
jgi:hypothetical protein